MNETSNPTSPYVTHDFFLRNGFKQRIKSKIGYPDTLEYVYYVYGVEVVSFSCWGGNPPHKSEFEIIQTLANCTHETTLRVIQERQKNLYKGFWQKD